MLLVHLPILTVSEANRRDHWRVKAKRAKSQRRTAAVLVPAFGLPCVVTLTRVALKPLDAHDNLRASLKHVVDGIADKLGVKDNDPRVAWQYAQRTGKQAGGVRGVEVLLEAAA